MKLALLFVPALGLTVVALGPSAYAQNAGSGGDGRLSVMDTLARIRANQARERDMGSSSSPASEAARAPAGGAEPRWYAIERFPISCEPQAQGPADFIRNAQNLQMQYRANDITDPGSGMVVETTIEVRELASQLTFYRTVERCRAVLDQRRASQARELERYR